MAALLRELEGLRVADSRLKGRKPPKEIVFVVPRLAARVEFREWTLAGTLRAPSFKGPFRVPTRGRWSGRPERSSQFLSLGLPEPPSPVPCLAWRVRFGAVRSASAW